MSVERESGLRGSQPPRVADVCVRVTEHLRPVAVCVEATIHTYTSNNLKTATNRIRAIKESISLGSSMSIANRVIYRWHGGTNAECC